MKKTQTQNSALNFYWKLQEVVHIYRQKENCLHNYTYLTNVTNPNIISNITI